MEPQKLIPNFRIPSGATATDAIPDGAAGRQFPAIELAAVSRTSIAVSDLEVSPVKLGTSISPSPAQASPMPISARFDEKPSTEYKLDI